MSSRSLDLFFRACEVAGLPNLSLGVEPTPRVMAAPFAVVGSDPGCDLVIDDGSVSSRQCYLQAIGSKVLCIDLGSRYEVGIGPAPSAACWLDPDHEVRVGGRVIRSSHESREPEGTGRPHLATGNPFGEQPLLARPMPRIVLDFKTNNILTHWKMRRLVALVGTAPECTVRLNGAGVSRYHCVLVLTGQGLWVVDLLAGLEHEGEGGVFVNETPVRFARVDPGDVLRAGSVSIGLRYVPGPVRRARPSLPQGADTVPTVLVSTTTTRDDRAGAPARASDSEIEALRRDYEEQLAGQTEQHRVEVESLRDVIEDLRDQVERLRSASTPKGRRRNRLKPDHRPSSVDETWPQRTPSRTLGSATRRVRFDSHPPAERALDAVSPSPPTCSDLLPMTGPGLVTRLAGRVASSLA